MCSVPDTMHAHGFVLFLVIIAGYQTGVTWSEIITNESLMTRNEAFTYCKTRDGSLLSSKSLVSSEIGELRVWTSDVIKLTDNNQCGHANATKLCSFIQLLHGKNEFGVILFGHCEATRSYACWNILAGGVVSFNDTYNVAIQCHYNPTPDEVKNLPSGYYWKNGTILCCQQQHTDSSVIHTPTTKYLCGVYSRDLGEAYLDCSERLNVACLLDSSETTIGAVSTFSTQDRHTGTGYSIGTGKTVSPVQLYTITKATNTGIGVKIGVPIAVSIAIICGVILSIVFIRRRSRKRSNQNNGMSRQIENQTNSSKAGKSQNYQHTYNYHNRGYENNVIEKQNAVESTEYNVQQDLENNQQSDDNNDYCFASDFDQESEHHVYDHTSEADEEYDTITSKRKNDKNENMSENVYNHVGSDEIEDVYDSTNPGKLRSGQESDNVYNELPNGGSVDDTQYSGLNFNPRRHNIKEENTYNTT